MKYCILPKPKHIEEKDGKKRLLNKNISYIGDTDKRVTAFGGKIEDILFSLGCVGCGFDIEVGTKADIPNEGYELTVDAEGVKIFGGGAAGCYYGLCTLRELIENEGTELPYLYIKDSPDFAYRGFYHDATRGRVPSVAGIKKLVDRLSALKVNSLQLYVEHTYDFVELRREGRGEEDYLTAEDILEIDSYCSEHFIDFVPSLSTF